MQLSRLCLLLCSILATLAYPVPSASSCYHQAVQILQRDTQDQSILVQFECYDCLESGDNHLFLTLQAPTCPFDTAIECSDLVVNQRKVEALDTAISSFIAYDLAGNEHITDAFVTIDFPSGPTDARPPVSHTSEFSIQAIDGITHDSVLIAHWMSDADGQFQPSYVKYITPSGRVEMDDLSCLKALPSSETSLDEQDIENELEELRLLEQEALQLQQEIAARRQMVSTRIAEYRSQKSLNELIEKCDGVVCAAQQIATRIYDKLNLATLDRSAYTTLQVPMQDSKTPNTTISQHDRNSTAASDRLFLQELGSSNDYFTRALAYIAGVLGLTALFLYIKRKCMSMRTRVERAADREERRNLRAFRRAARRAEMRKRLSCFTFPNFFRQKQQPRMTDYDEKRALILQDALLEQDFRQFEKGDIMEAEIRQLRHAHEIVSNMVQGEKDPRSMLVRDLPPSQVPLPFIRSRSSTSTLPSYNSDDLPDYSSQPEATNENTTTDGFAYYRPSIESNYPHAAPSEASNNTRSTPVSSIPNISRRASQETLLTRGSRVESLGSTR